MKHGEKAPSLEEYLEAIRSSKIYQGEEFQTLDGVIMEFLSFLAQHNQVSNDWDGNGSGEYCLGSYHPKNRVAPVADWFQGYRRVGVYGIVTGNRDADFGVRCGVRVI